MEFHTIVERLPDQLGYHCGYCGSEDTAKAKGMWSHSMTALDYQTLIDRGWRRSGKYCYKPIMEQTCCPQYTLKCKALDFKISKSKKKVLNRMRQFLMSEGDEEVVKWKAKNAYQKGVKTPSKEAEISGEFEPQTDVVDTLSGDQNKVEPKKGTGPDPSKPLCKKAKLLRLEKQKKKSSKMESGDAAPSSSQKNGPRKTLREMIPHLNPSPDFKKKLEVRMVHANKSNSEFLSTKLESSAVYQKYQVTIHNDKLSECTESQWMRFLVDCAIPHDETGPGPGLGNYHQQYVLDGKLIAVGVVDVLPNSLSSVYLYYDPDYGFLSLGTYTALSEIAYIQQLHETHEQLQYYYMGFYIHSCPKMNYKRGFPPSEVLCPETYEWVPIEVCLPAMDKSEYSRLNVLIGGSLTAEDPDKGDDFDINELGVMYRRNLVKYYKYVRWKYAAVEFPEQNEIGLNSEVAKRQKEEMARELTELKEYVSIVGTACAQRMHLYRPVTGITKIFP